MFVELQKASPKENFHKNLGKIKKKKKNSVRVHLFLLELLEQEICVYEKWAPHLITAYYFAEGIITKFSNIRF